MSKELTREEEEAFAREVEHASSVINARINSLSKYYENLRKQKKAIASDITQARSEMLAQKDRIGAAAKNVGEKECSAAMESAAKKLDRAASLLKNL